MSKIELLFFLGIVVGAIMWAAITSLIESAGFLPIFGLALSVGLMGGVLGWIVKGEVK